ncbi:MAG: DUF1887 family CARF protein [Melioribacter sp.]|uniref:Card1-like endonuclease domain-containing protein n=1 Tax=Rosettibacter primus TaxID=3111523 RepID=UPI00247B9835|nr:DUF1887 family CARF protein [Melioribacter sp.]
MIENFFSQFNLKVVNYKIYDSENIFNGLAEELYKGKTKKCILLRKIVNKCKKKLLQENNYDDLKLLNEIRSIINGKWLEIYTCFLLFKIINECAIYFSHINYQIYYDVELTSIYNNKHYELDVIAVIENYIYWIECKSGSFDESDIKKYSAIKERLEFDDNHAFCVLHLANPKYCQKIEEKYDFRTITSEQFFTILWKCIFNDLYKIRDELDLIIKNEN